MKIEKKHIIIAIVVAVAAWLLWKNHKGRVVYTSTAPGSGDGSIEDIIAASGMTDADARFVRQFASRIEANLSSKAEMETKALNRGYTYEQMVVLDGLWTKYRCMVDGVSRFKDGVTPEQMSYYWKVTKTIMNY